MKDFIVDLKRQLDDIKATDATPENLKAFNSEDDFNGLGVDLLIETGSYVCVAACLLPTNTGVWNRDQAVIGGNFVRLFKLISAILNQTCQRRRETTFIFARLAFETIVNLSYMIKNASPELFNSYLRYSLQHEKKLQNLIQERIAARNGEELPVEKRMLDSIRQAFEKSEIEAKDTATSGIRNWGDKNIFERAKDVGLEDAYLAAFGGGSHSVHGNWMDLIEYHLDGDGYGFKPQLEWRRPRPQILTAIASLSTKVILQYFQSLDEPEIAKLVDEPLENLVLRIRQIATAHEEFLHR